MAWSDAIGVGTARVGLALLSGLVAAACSGEHILAHEIADGGSADGASADGGPCLATFPVPRVLSPGDGRFVQVSTGLAHSCALRANGELYCWGLQILGHVAGMPVEEEMKWPKLVMTDVVQVETSVAGVCAVKGDGRIHCFGNNSFGVISGESGPVYDPVPLPGVVDAVQVAMGQSTACALTGEGALCWGRNVAYSGAGGPEPAVLPTVTPAPVPNPIAIDVGGMICAETRSCETACWGLAYLTSSGLGKAQTIDGAAQARSLVVSDSHGCIVDASSKVRCWGDNFNGAVGPCEPCQRATYQVAAGEVPGVGEVAQVAVANGLSCARRLDGSVVCWGLHYQDSSTTYVRQPWGLFAVPGLEDATDIAVAERHACALKSDGTVVCWGDNEFMQLGDGTTVYSSDLVSPRLP